MQAIDLNGMPLENEDYTESDDEGQDGYRKGGYHVVTPGETYNSRYRVLAKLGWGHFSTVWLCEDMQTGQFVAMKVQKSAAHYTEAAYDEIELLAQAAKKGSDSKWDAKIYQGLLGGHNCTTQPFTGVVQLVDYFEHHGPNGKHVCMVFETMGPNVLALIKRYNFKGIPLEIVRKVAAHTLIGLDYLHRICGIIHTDLKPENVLVSCPKGVPVNKIGVPLVGNVDPALLAAKKEAMPQKLLQNKDKTKQAEKKKGKKKGKGEADDGKDGDDNDDGETEDKKEDAKDAAGLAKGQPTAEAQADEKGNSPPYMVPHLKPTRSDPSLLSSYGDIHTALMRRPYHHLRSQQQAQYEQALGSNPGYPPAKAAGSAPQAYGQPGAWLGGSSPNQLNQPLLDDVMKLDLFDHDTVTYKVADLGNACWIEKHFSDDIQTRQYRGPETIINAGYDTSADIWSLACMIFELVTGDYLFDPKASEEYPRDEDHLALFVELLGPMPKSLISRSRRAATYFNRRGELRHIKSLRYWALEDVLRQKYHMHHVEAVNLASFLLPMLRLSPNERSPAMELLQHPWLLGLPSPEAERICIQMGPPAALNAGHPERRRGDPDTDPAPA